MAGRYIGDKSGMLDAPVNVTNNFVYKTARSENLNVHYVGRFAGCLNGI
jgi:hypothetical protein